MLFSLFDVFPLALKGTGIPFNAIPTWTAILEK